MGTGARCETLFTFRSIGSYFGDDNCFLFAFIVLLPQLLKLGTLSQEIIQRARSDDLTIAKKVDSME